jgi:hypothetical protein
VKGRGQKSYAVSRLGGLYDFVLIKEVVQKSQKVVNEGLSRKCASRVKKRGRVSEASIRVPTPL